MKKIIISAALISLQFASTTWACDAVLKGTRDCQIQDRFRQVRDEFKNTFNTDVSDIAEYRVLRFIDRGSWEYAKSVQKAPKDIYKPTPSTWNVWNKGIKKLFPANVDLKQIDLNTFSQINQVLLTDGTVSIKDDQTDQNKAPGQYRNEQDDTQVGFCTGEPGDYKTMAEQSEQSMLAVQKAFEKKMKMSFLDLVKKEKGIDPFMSTIGVSLRSLVPAGCGPKKDGVWISYVRARQVAGNMDWMRIFLKANLDLYDQHNPLLTPIELAALLQKWFVTVHPFADGNGRTSRAYQDLILEKFDLPFAPGGDLQNDALETYSKYIEMTYAKTEAMLQKLESCLQEYKSRTAISFSCKTTESLNQ